jgi:colicin import membrane protein
MRPIFSWILSLLLHGAVLASGMFLSAPSSMHIDLGVPVYQVDLVNLKPLKGAPAKAAPAPAAQKKTVDVTPPAAPKPAPAPEPKPEAKPIAAKAEEPKPKAEEAPAKPKPVEKKPEPKPKPPEKTKEQMLAEALADAKREAQAKAKAEANDRKALEKNALADIAKLVAEQDAAMTDNPAEGPGAGGEDDDGVPMGLEAIYAARVKEIIKSNWRFPNIPVKQSLIASVFMRVDEQGRITEAVLAARSGRPDFDESVLKAVQETEQLPPPPGSVREMRINFNLQDMR